MSARKLPEGWMTSHLSEVCSKPQYGYTTKSNSIGDVKFLRTTDITKGAVDWSCVPYCMDAPEDVSKYQLQDRDIVISRAGSVGFSFLVKKPPGQVVFASYLIRFKPSNYFSENYLKRFLESSDYWNQLSSMSSGNAVQNVNAQKLSTLIVPIAPMAEQKIIAEKLDTLLAQVDNTKARLEQIPKILKRFRQAVLERAVNGKLTESWRDAIGEMISAEEIITEIKKYRKELLSTEGSSKSTESKRQLAKIDKHCVNAPEINLPKGWVWTTFLQSMEKVVDCHNKTAPYVNQGIHLIRTPDIRNGVISLKNTKYIDNDTYLYWSKRCPPRSGDIIFTREAPMGEAGIIPENTVLCMGQRMMLLRPIPQYLNNKYVLLNILSSSFQTRMISQAIGTGVKHLRVADVESLTYSLPPIEEQHEIVRHVEQLFAYADTIEKQVNNALARVNNLTQSILAKAFRGELTAQWRAENPDLISGENSATALLEKIKAERAVSGSKKNARKKA
ncbi:restriction endonuclease subunit S [Serratia fonticola]|uniref:restriction endonuclease subunit S n=1 Tax=Serratia fonticola TaxID=47917 RepID=UPI003AAF5562